MPVVDACDTASWLNPTWLPRANLHKIAKPRFRILEMHACDQKILYFHLKWIKPDNGNTTTVDAGHILSLKIQYGHHDEVCIKLQTYISWEAFERSVWNFVGSCIKVRYTLNWIFRLILNPIWPQGGHLGFSFPLNILRTIWTISFKFSRQLYQGKIQV